MAFIRIIYHAIIIIDFTENERRAMVIMDSSI